MARVFQYRSRNGPLFGIDYVDKLTGRRHQLRVGATKKGDAQALLREKLNALVKAQIVGASSVESLKPVTFAQFTEKEYLPWSKATKRDKTYRRNLSLFANVKPTFGSSLLHAIRTVDVEKYIVRRTAAICHRGACKGNAPCECTPRTAGTINRERTFIGAVLNMALRRGLIKQNPVPLVDKLDEDNTRDRWMTRAELERTLAFAPEWLQPLVTAAVHTGLRLGELVDLRWADIDRELGFIKVGQRSKTHRVRHVPINSTVDALLAGLEPFVGSGGSVAHVFVNEATVKPYRANSVYHAFVRAAKAAGYDDVVFHTLRHTFASWLIQAGVSEREVQEYLGHASATMTARYAHLAPVKERRNALEVLTGAGAVTNPLKKLAPQQVSRKMLGAKRPGSSVG